MNYDPSDSVFTQAWKASSRSLQSSAPFWMLEHKDRVSESARPVGLFSNKDFKLHAASNGLCSNVVVVRPYLRYDNNLHSGSTNHGPTWTDAKCLMRLTCNMKQQECEGCRSDSTRGWTVLTLGSIYASQGTVHVMVVCTWRYFLRMASKYSVFAIMAG